MDGYPEYPFDIMDIASLLHLTIRRELSASVYVDCPFCGKRKGKLNLNLQKNVWRCNRCGEAGHMVELYARLCGLSVKDAELELVDVLCGGIALERRALEPAGPGRDAEIVKQSPLASPEDIDKTMRVLLQILQLSDGHRRHLHEERGLTDQQIQKLGLKSTPSYKQRHTIPQRLKAQGCTIAGVPGFFVDKYNKWTANFTTWTAGIMIPVRSVDGLVQGAQIRLDVPIRDRDDPEDEGTKYIWFSTASKHLGVSSGSPVNFIGDPHARTVYVTEGCLKAGIAHCLMDRTFVSVQGANNLGGLKKVLEQLHRNGTELLIEAHDMDKYNNRAVAQGASKLCALARECGMECRSLTWNPNYKGVDDWQLALRRKKDRQTGRADEKDVPDGECHTQRFRVYQLDLAAGEGPRPFAFKGVAELRESGYEQPPAAQYALVCDGSLSVPDTEPEEAVLERIFDRFNDDLPDDYHGRSIAPSDVLELYGETEGRRYFYCDKAGYVPVRFSPALCRRAGDMET